MTPPLCVWVNSVLDLPSSSLTPVRNPSSTFSFPTFNAIDAKLDSKSALHLINELADLHSCNNTLYFEARRHEDLYLWASKTPNGPSAKFHVQNVHTMDELKMTGNCLKGSRGIVSFCGGWDEGEHWRLMKEMLTHVRPVLGAFYVPLPLLPQGLLSLLLSRLPSAGSPAGPG